MFLEEHLMPVVTPGVAGSPCTMLGMQTSAQMHLLCSPALSAAAKEDATHCSPGSAMQQAVRRGPWG